MSLGKKEDEDDHNPLGLFKKKKEKISVNKAIGYFCFTSINIPAVSHNANSTRLPSTSTSAT